MSEPGATPTQSASSGWGRRVVWAFVGLAALVVLGLVASATVPRWWAQRIGDQVGGSIVQGTLLGLFYGFVFTLLPIVALVLILRWRRTWKTVLVAVAIALVFALPNLMTLGIVLGTGNAAHAGERTLDVEAPAFRGGSLGGALLAAGLVTFVVYLFVSRRRARDRATRADDALSPTPDP